MHDKATNMEHNDHQHDSKPYTREDHELDMLRFKQEIKEMEEELASRQGVVAPIDKENKKLAEALKGVEKTVKMAEDVDEQVLLKKIKKMEDKIKVSSIYSTVIIKITLCAILIF